MNKFFDLLRKPFCNNAFEKKVDQELRFHVDMQALEYEREGLSPEESQAKAELRFGNFSRVKKQCVRIGSQDRLVIRITRIFFSALFLLGVLVRIVSPEFHVTRVGDILMMIGGLGSLLLYLKKVGSPEFKSDEKPIQLQLTSPSDARPVGFDEEGRTPFDRVRAE